MKFMRILASLILTLFFILPALAADPADSTNSAGALYSSSVDLANEGRYRESLNAADRALAMNVTSLTGLIQSNRAGILVMLNRNEEAITAADAALAVEGNLTTVHSIAWYNKGNALRALGRIREARESYARAYELDPALTPPDLPSDTAVTAPAFTLETPRSPSTTESVQAKLSVTRSPITPGAAVGAILAALICLRYRRAV